VLGNSASLSPALPSANPKMGMSKDCEQLLLMLSSFFEKIDQVDS
jgi:hypothetical protein